MNAGHFYVAETVTTSWINYEVNAEFHPSLKDVSQQRSQIDPDGSSLCSRY